MPRLSLLAHRAIRIALLLVVAGGIGLLAHRLKRTDEQVELARYVELQLPPLLEEERSAVEALDHLLADKTLAAPAARKRLVDDITPRLVHVRRRAEALSPATLTVRQLAAQYLLVLDAWTEACRTAIRAIDDPKLSTEAGLLAVKERLIDAAQLSKRFDAEVVHTCQQHRLSPPSASSP